MIKDDRFIIISGTARNVGKTSLACHIIKSLSHKNIIALKFVTIKKDGHKHNHHFDVDSYEIIEEKSLNLEKDTSKMLNSGAQKSFLIISQEEYIQDALSDFLNLTEQESVIVAESASLRNYIIPKTFIVVDRENATNKKEYIIDLIPLSDFIVRDIKNNKELNSITDSLK